MRSIRYISSFLILLISLSGILNLAYARLPATVNGQVLPSLADMLARVTPAVVNISTESVSGSAKLDEPVYQHFFGKRMPSKKAKRMGTGSGIIINARDGYIVTNAHVIEKAAKIIVTLKDQRQFYATLVGQDLKADIAVIRIEPERLTEMRIASSKNLRVGDFVVAIGNPFGLGQSVTSGIISALGRTGLGIEDYENFIQTDASINPGNSGGALVNLRGELIGINTAILGGRGGGNVGIGFAIPSDMIVNIKEQLVQNGRVVRGKLGIEIQDLRPALVKAFKLIDGQGALISGVVLNSPAEVAGIREGDVITRINGTVVSNSSNLKSMIGNLRLGSKVRMEYMRDGVIQKAVAKVGLLDDRRYSVKSSKKVTPKPKLVKPVKKKNYYKDLWSY